MPLSSSIFPLLIVSALWLAAPVGAAGQEHLEQTREDLQQVREKIEQTSAGLTARKQAAQKLLRELQEVNRSLGKARERVRSLGKKLQQLEEQIGRQRTALEEGRAKSAALEGQVRERLIALYKGGDVQWLKILFSARSPAAISEDYHFLQRLAQRDRDLLDRYRELVRQNEEQLAELNRLRDEQTQAIAQRRGEEAALQKNRGEKQRLLDKARKDQETLALVLAELEAKAASLSSLVKKLETEKPRTYTEFQTSFASQKGRLSWPVAGPVKLGFGPGRHPDLGTRYDSHGIEIGVTGETSIAAVWDGQVIFANQFRGFGNLLILDHGDGYYSLYAQASRLLHRVGDRVARREPLAYSGFEGSDVVYFEIRQGSTPLDPLAWLNQR